MAKPTLDEIWQQSMGQAPGMPPTMINPQVGSGSFDLNGPVNQSMGMIEQPQFGQIPQIQSAPQEPKKSFGKKVVDFLGQTTGISGLYGASKKAGEISRASDELGLGVHNEVQRLISEAKKFKTGDPKRKALLKQAQEVARQGGVMADELLAGVPRNRQVVGSAIKLAGTAASLGGMGAGASAVAPATTFASGATRGAIAGAKVGGLFGGVSGFGGALEKNKSVGDAVSSGVIGAGVGAVSGGVIGGVTGGISGFLHGRAVREAEVRKMLERKTLDTESTPALTRVLSKDPATKAALRQGLPETDAKLLRTLSETDQKAARDMYRVAARAANDRTATVRTQDVAGKTLVEKVSGLVAKRKEVGQKIGEAVGSSSSGFRSLAPVRESFLDDLADDGVELIGKNLDFSGSAYAENGAAQNQIDTVWRIISKGRMSDQNIWTARKVLDEVIDIGGKQNTLSSNVDRVLGGVRRGLSDVLMENSGYAKYAPQYSALSDTLNKFGKIMGPDFNIYGGVSEFSTSRAGEVGARVLSNASARPLAVVNQIDRLAEQYGIGSGSSYSQFHVADFMDDLFNLTQSRSLQGQVGKAVAKGNEALSIAGDIANRDAGSLLTRGWRAIQGISDDNLRLAVKKMIGL